VAKKTSKNKNSTNEKQLKIIMKKIPIILVLCIAFFAHTMRAADFIHISEIFYNTSPNEAVTASSFSNGEYLEFFNAGLNPVNMEGWVVRGDGDADIYTFGSVIIQPRSFLILAHRYNWTPDFELSEVFTDMDEDGGQIVYQNKIILTNTGKFVRLFDPTGLLRDSIYSGDVTSIQSVSDQLIATNPNDTPASECRSVQRKIVEFDDRGVAISCHLHWYVDIARPFDLSPFYTVLVNETVSFEYDAAGNRIARTIILQQLNTSQSTLLDIDDYDWWKSDNPLSDIIDEFQVKIHPNPTHGRVTVEIDMEGRDIESIELMVVTQNGMLIVHKRTTSALISVDLMGAPIGNYTLYITINGRAQQYKIVKL
jgi:hypothetical protein